MKRRISHWWHMLSPDERLMLLLWVALALYALG